MIDGEGVLLGFIVACLLSLVALAWLDPQAQQAQAVCEVRWEYVMSQADTLALYREHPECVRISE